MPIRITTLVVCLSFGLSATFVCAQGRTTTTAGTGQTAATGNTAATSAASSAQGGATGNTGGGGGGGNTGVQPSTGNQPIFNAGDGSVGAQIGQNAFTGQGNNGFVGSRNAGQATRNRTTPQFSQMGDSNVDPNTGNTGNVRTKRARPQQRIAFTYPKANLALTQTKLSTRFKQQSKVAGADTRISDEGVATLIGTVKDEDARKLAEALTRLEPGVRSIVNELKVEVPTP